MIRRRQDYGGTGNTGTRRSGGLDKMPILVKVEA